MHLYPISQCSFTLTFFWSTQTYLNPLSTVKLKSSHLSQYYLSIVKFKSFTFRLNFFEEKVLNAIIIAFLRVFSNLTFIFISVDLCLYLNIFLTSLKIFWFAFRTEGLTSKCGEGNNSYMHMIRQLWSLNFWGHELTIRPTYISLCSWSI